jgi:nucleotide-binding universal stress UspA family protein
VFDRIIAGYAGDQAGRDAVRLAATLAALCGGELTIVFPYQPLLASVSADVAEQRVREEVAALILDVEGSPAPTYHWTPSSWPIHGLHELARYEGAGLIVLGSARGGLADHLHISLMERMVHGAPCAVAVANAHYGDGPLRQLLRIGVGFSTSQEGRSALQVARELAALAGGRVDVIAAASLEPALASHVFSSRALPEAERQVFLQTKATLERVTEGLGGEVALERETIRGDPASVLIERSRELDVLVLGSRAYGPARHALLGSVSARVMREARCPVLVVPRGVDRGDAEVGGGEAGAARHEAAAD